MFAFIEMTFHDFFVRYRGTFILENFDPTTFIYKALNNELQILFNNCTKPLPLTTKNPNMLTMI